MAYDTYAESLEQSRPIDIYQIAQGQSVWRWNGSEDAVTVSGLVYPAQPVTRSDITLGGEGDGQDLQITLPSTYEFVSRYAGSIPTGIATITLSQYERLDGVQEVRLLFKGIVKSVTFVNDGYGATIAAKPLTGGVNLAMPRVRYHSLCSHVLYDDLGAAGGCRVDRDLFKHSGTVSAASSNNRTLTIPGLNSEADGYWEGGHIKTSDSNYSMVLSHTGNDITLLRGIPGLVGESVEVFAGCDFLIGTCHDKFDNVINFGGFAYVPTKDPHGGFL